MSIQNHSKTATAFRLALAWLIYTTALPTPILASDCDKPLRLLADLKARFEPIETSTPSDVQIELRKIANQTVNAFTLTPPEHRRSIIKLVGKEFYSTDLEKRQTASRKLSDLIHQEWPYIPTNYRLTLRHLNDEILLRRDPGLRQLNIFSSPDFGQFLARCEATSDDPTHRSGLEQERNRLNEGIKARYKFTLDLLRAQARKSIDESYSGKISVSEAKQQLHDIETLKKDSDNDFLSINRQLLTALSSPSDSEELRTEQAMSLANIAKRDAKWLFSEEAGLKKSLRDSYQDLAHYENFERQLLKPAAKKPTLKEIEKYYSGYRAFLAKSPNRSGSLSMIPEFGPRLLRARPLLAKERPLVEAAERYIVHTALLLTASKYPRSILNRLTLAQKTGAVETSQKAA